MKRREITFTLHLYSADPQYTIPATHQWGEDIEFNGNERANLYHHSTHFLNAICDGKLHFSAEDSSWGVLLMRNTFYIGEEGDEHYQFVVNFLTDSHPWPQRDAEACKERKWKADHGELGQAWWIHHITLPDGQELDVDTVTKDAENTIRKYIEHELIDFVNTQVPGMTVTYQSPDWY